jgi:hypothetical protein
LEWAGWMPREFCSSWGAYGCKIDDDLTTVSLGRKEADVRWASTLVWVC